MVTVCCGDSSATEGRFPPWVAAHDFSAAEEPMTKLPAGITTISGQPWQSRKKLPGAADNTPVEPGACGAQDNVAQRRGIHESLCVIASV
jgi:hypothetical protein